MNLPILRYLVLSTVAKHSLRNILVTGVTEEGISYRNRGRPGLALRNKNLSFEEEVYAHIYGQLITQGYMPVPVPNGWMVIGGTRPYSLKEIHGEWTCDCGSMNWMGGLEDEQGKGTGCKHIHFLKGHLLFRGRIQKERQEALKSGL